MNKATKRERKGAMKRAIALKGNDDAKKLLRRLNNTTKRTKLH